MKMVKIFIIALMMVSVIAGGFAAVAKTSGLAAGFMADVNTGAAPLTVHFKDTSEGNPTGWYWDFGDNSSSTLRDPVYTYNTPGRYTVNLTVTDGTQSDTVSADIVITNPMVTTPTPDPVRVIIRPVPLPVKNPHHVRLPHDAQPPAHQPPHRDPPTAPQPPAAPKLPHIGR